MTKIAVDPNLDLVTEGLADSATARWSFADSEPLSELLVLLCTFPTAEAVGEIALTLVGESLCACVNILPESLSIYRWNDEIVTNKEVQCLIKTTRACHAALVARLNELHPYEVPEIVTLAASAVNLPYLKWVNAVTQGGPQLAVQARSDADEADQTAEPE